MQRDLITATRLCKRRGGDDKLGSYHAIIMRLSQSYLMFRASFKHACADLIPNIGQQRSSSDPAVVAKYRGSPIPSHPKPTSQCTSPMSQQTKKFSYTIVVSTKHHGTRQTGGAREQERPLLHKHAQRQSSAHTAIPCISRCHGLHSHPGSGARSTLSAQQAGRWQGKTRKS